MKKIRYILFVLFCFLSMSLVHAAECPRITEDSIVVYNAGDYPNTPYCTGMVAGCTADGGANNLCTSGCYPLTIASILATYGLDYGPEDISSYLCETFPANAQSTEYGSVITPNKEFHNQFSMSIETIGNRGDDATALLTKVDQTLAENKMLMVSVYGGAYSGSGGAHYVAIAMKKNGQYYVVNTGRRGSSGFVSQDYLIQNVLSVVHMGLYVVAPTQCDLVADSGTSGGGSDTDKYEDYLPNLDDPDDITCEGIFKNGDDFNEFGQFLQDIFTAIKVLAPALVIILSTIDYIKAIAASNQDAMKKANQRTIKRVVIGLIVFFLPFLLDLLFELFGVYDLTTCDIR